MKFFKTIWWRITKVPMSDTPRTDAALVKWKDPNRWMHPEETLDMCFADFARTLERENNQLREALKVCVEALKLSEDLPELNLGNYTHDDVCGLNDKATDVYLAQKQALALSSVQSALSNNGTRP